MVPAHRFMILPTGENRGAQPSLSGKAQDGPKWSKLVIYLAIASAIAAVIVSRSGGWSLTFR